jgi:hypothetical protein
MLGPKALDCLRLASLPIRSDERRVLYKVLCARWSEKALCKSMELLASKEYIDYGVSARTGWLTSKGHSALMELK